MSETLAQPIHRPRSTHPGVKIRKRVWKGTGETTYFARWRDPDTGREKDTNLDKLNLTSDEKREDWAKRRSKSLVMRRAALASGAPRRTETSIKTAMEEFFRGADARLRPATITCYERTVNVFGAWLEKRRIRNIEDVDRAVLARFRDHVCSVKRMAPKRQGKRYERIDGMVPRSPATINSDLRDVKAVLNRLRVLGYTPFLDRDAISEGLQGVPGHRPTPMPLSAGQCRSLLLAALRHDIATFELTRKEHAEFPSATALNLTPQHDPISPFVLFMLMTGARAGEALKLRWEDVDLDAPDDFGKPAGEIRLEPTATKTRIGRRVDLSVCPSLRSLLVALKLRAGDSKYVFGDAEPRLHWKVDRARNRMRRDFNSPTFTWQRLRQTTASFLTSAPSIFRSASVYRSAAQLGHSPTIAMRYYLNAIRGISPEAKVLEDAMRVRDVVDQIVALAKGNKVAPEIVAEMSRPTGTDAVKP